MLSVRIEKNEHHLQALSRWSPRGGHGRPCAWRFLQLACMPRLQTLGVRFVTFSAPPSQPQTPGLPARQSHHTQFPGETWSRPLSWHLCMWGHSELWGVLVLMSSTGLGWPYGPSRHNHISLGLSHSSSRPGFVPRVFDTMRTLVVSLLGVLGVKPGEACLAGPPSVLTLGVNRNIKSLLGGQETGNNQNIVSCPLPGHWAACHGPSFAAWVFPAPPPPSGG